MQGLLKILVIIRPVSTKPPKDCPVCGEKLDKAGACVHGHIFIWGGTVEELKKGFKSDHRKERK